MPTVAGPCGARPACARDGHRLRSRLPIGGGTPSCDLFQTWKLNAESTATDLPDWSVINPVAFTTWLITPAYLAVLESAWVRWNFAPRNSAPATAKPINGIILGVANETDEGFAEDENHVPERALIAFYTAFGFETLDPEIGEERVLMTRTPDICGGTISPSHAVAPV